MSHRVRQLITTKAKGTKMRRRAFLHRLVVASAAPLTATLSGCGTLFHSERIHRPHSRDIDWEIAALNGLGLALFFVPGVLAFVVDFYTGAIYLPPDGHRGYPVPAIPRPPASEQLTRTPGHTLEEWKCEPLPRDHRVREGIEIAISRRIGQPIRLCQSATRVSRLVTWNAFGQQVESHLRDASHGVPAEAFFAELA